jgi:hypothetical protein
MYRTTGGGDITPPFAIVVCEFVASSSTEPLTLYVDLVRSRYYPWYYTSQVLPYQNKRCQNIFLAQQYFPAQTCDYLPPIVLFFIAPSISELVDTH